MKRPELEAQGHDRVAAAVAARRSLGNVPLTRKRARDVRIVPWLNDHVAGLDLGPVADSEAKGGVCAGAAAGNSIAPARARAPTDTRSMGPEEAHGAGGDVIHPAHDADLPFLLHRGQYGAFPASDPGREDVPDPLIEDRLDGDSRIDAPEHDRPRSAATSR